jgi:hypothetical protein
MIPFLYLTPKVIVDIVSSQIPAIRRRISSYSIGVPPLLIHLAIFLLPQIYHNNSIAKQFSQQFNCQPQSIENQ